MFSECVKCERIGVSCIGPRIADMGTAELLAWCKERKKELRISNARLAELSGTPKGTIDRIFAGEHADFRYETIRPLFKALTGGTWERKPCEALQEDGALREEIKRLEKEQRWQEEKLQHFMDENKRLREELKEARASEKEQREYHLEEIRRKNRTTSILAVVIALALAYIIVTLIIDRADPSQGFYWLEGLLHLPQSINNQTSLIM